jgi:hypothetical protein
MLSIKGRIQLQLSINNKEFPFDRVNALDFLHMSSSVRLSLPMIHFKVLDAARWLSKEQDLVDGATIQVAVSVLDEKVVYPFRLHTFRETLSSTGPAYEIDGYFDSVAYWLLSTPLHIKGTSNFALNKIATTCQIANYSGTPTADDQLWISKNKQYRTFAKDIMERGYVNETSCMQLAFDLNGTLIYKNLSEKRTKVAQFITSKYQSNSFIVTDFRIKSNSGFLNSVSGYADEVHAQSLGTNDTFNKVTATPLTSRMMVNTDVNKTVARGRVSFAPIDGGNTHDNYEKAFYQNMRLSNLFSFGLEIVTPDVTNLALLDYISYEAKIANKEKVSAYSGEYYITSKAIYIQGINYYEKFELVRQGIQTSSKNLES